MQLKTKQWRALGASTINDEFHADVLVVHDFVRSADRKRIRFYVSRVLHRYASPQTPPTAGIPPRGSSGPARTRRCTTHCNLESRKPRRVLCKTSFFRLVSARVRLMSSSAPSPESVRDSSKNEKNEREGTQGEGLERRDLRFLEGFEKVVDVRKGKMVLHHRQVAQVEVVLPVRF